MSQSVRRPSLVLWIATLALVAAAWASTLSGDFLLDDYGLSWFAHPDGSVDWTQVGRFFFPSHLTKDQFLRPIPVTAGAIDIHFWGANAFGYHLTNLLIHLATALAVGLVAAKLFRRAATGPLVALLYGLYPGHAESVAWIIHRMVGMTVLFIALTLLLHARRRWRPLAWVAALAGLACKEPAAIVPAAVFLFDCARSSAPWRQRMFAAIRAAMPYLVVIAVYVGWKWLAFGKLSTGYGKYASYGDYFFGESVYLEIPMSVVRFLFPLNGVVLDQVYGARAGVMIAFRLILGAAFLIALVSGLRRPETRRLAVFGSLLAILSLCLVSPFLRVSDELTNSRHFSAPAMGLVMVLAAGALSFTSMRAKLAIGVAFAFWFAALPVNQYPYAAAGEAARDIREGVAGHLARQVDRPYEEGTTLFVVRVPDLAYGAPVFGDGAMLDAALSAPFVDPKVLAVKKRCRLVASVWNEHADPGTVLYSLDGPIVVLSFDPDDRVRSTGPMPRWEPDAPLGGALLSPIDDRPVRVLDDPLFTFRFPTAYRFYRLVFVVGERRIGFTVSRQKHIHVGADGRLSCRLSGGDVTGPRNFLASADLRRLRGPVTWWVEAVNDHRMVSSAVVRTAPGRFVVTP